MPLCASLLFLGAPTAAAEETPDYAEHIAPIFNKHCVACHNADDREGQLNLESFAELQRGGERGAALLAGDSAASRLIRTLTGHAEPAMPPAGSDPPSEEEIALLKAWIDAGARGPAGAEPDRRMLLTPQLPAAKTTPAITALAYSPDGKILAVARFGEVELIDAATRETLRTLGEHPGKVNAVSFSADGKQIVTASGVAGMHGEARVWNAADGSLVRAYPGHRDTLYTAVLSPTEPILATAGYDREIILWNANTGEPLRTLRGHNDAIYEIAFHPQGKILASASGDRTVKVWSVATGERLDTMSQPLKEQYAVAFTPDGKFVLGGGADNRIRVWQVASLDGAAINPLVHARFAHEGAIVRMSFAANGGALVSAADDRTVKLWETAGYTQTHAFEQQADAIGGLALSPNGKTIAVGRLDGSFNLYDAPAPRPRAPAPNGQTAADIAASQMEDEKTAEFAEQEPNDAPDRATPITLPCVVSGAIHADKPAGESAAKANATAAENDVDLYRFAARAGETWFFEIEAARPNSPLNSPLDSRLEILDAEGRPVPRVQLQAVRDSYITFRGVGSSDGEVRLHNWEEMELNEYLYLQGEVCKLFRAPRGPDSGFLMVQSGGGRRGYFDTTATSHALNETCYIVEPRAPEAELIPNGLPVFRLNYENDDDPLRHWGRDSRLAFVAPRDGEYMVRVSDVRGHQGESYRYKLAVRRPRHDFSFTIGGQNHTVPAGGGKAISVAIHRQDGYDGAVRIDITGLPPGFYATTPLVIEAGHNSVTGVLVAAPDAPAPTAENAGLTQLTATATLNGKEVVRPIGSLGEIKLGPAPNLRVAATRVDAPSPFAAEAEAAEAEEAEANAEPQPAAHTEPWNFEIPEITIAPGETVPVKLWLLRTNFPHPVSFGGAAAAGLPHGIIVDNIGLNGVLIPEGQTERTVYLSAARWVEETDRLFFFATGDDGGQATLPLLLKVRRK